MTEAQKKAANPVHSVWVTANAGTGKTKVLTDRVLRLLLTGARPGAILCLTFTKAAASEMKSRIHAKLANWAIVDDAILSKSLEELTDKVPDKTLLQSARKLFLSVLDAPDSLKIQTIHSFCQSLMSRFPMEAGIPPHFQVIDDQTAEELLKEARIQLLTAREQPERLHSAIQEIAWRVAESSFTDLIKEVVDKREVLAELHRRYGNIEEIITALYSQLGVREGETERVLLEKLCSDEYVNKSLLQQAVEALSKSSTNDNKTAQKIAPWLAASVEERITTFTKYCEAFFTAEHEPKKPSSIITEGLQKKTDTAIAKALFDEQERLVRAMDSLRSLRIAEATSHLLYIADNIITHYQTMKTNRAFLDYQDLIIATNRLLQQQDVAPWILYKLDNSIDHILVDEAQDTSPAQWQLIDKLTQEFFAGNGAKELCRTVFVVGDEKQSIFSFQGADPKVFGDMHHIMQERVHQAEQQWHSIGLDRSFRSVEPILGLVDKIFSTEVMKKAVAISLEDIRHDAHRLGHAGRVELWPLISSPEKQEKIAWELPVIQKEPHNSKAILARMIARKVKQWLNEKRILVAKGRPIEAGDILLLLRKRGEMMQLLVQAFKQENIPIGGMDRMTLKENLAVMDMEALGKFLLLPEDDLTLAVLLKTPLIGMNEEDLYHLAYSRGESSLWQRLRESKYREIYAYLSDLLAKVDYSSPFELFSYVLEVQGGRKKFAKRLGEEVYEPLDEFINLTLDYERSHVPSLQGFLHWLEAGSVEIKREQEQNQNGQDSKVRIMTVHGSKGLQAPVVIMADATTTPTANYTLLTDEESRLLFWAPRAEDRNDFYKALYKNKKHAEYNEYLRLLYVALTRAEDELYIAGYEYGKKNSLSNWYDIIQEAMEKEAKETPFILPGGEEKCAYVISNEQQIEVKISQDSISQKKALPTLPEFLSMPAPEEPEPSIPLTPSRPSEENPIVRSPAVISASDMIRGTLIHKLLQYLPEISRDEREQAAKRLLAKYRTEFTEKQQQEIIYSVLSLLHDNRFMVLFSESSQAEVPIAGRVGDFVISGQIDRLVVLEKEVVIVDYKTHRLPPAGTTNIAPAYVRQMAHYKAALQEIYPGKTIRCFLLWTETLAMMELESGLLEPFMPISIILTKEHA